MIVRLSNWVGEVVLSLPAIRLLQATGACPHLVGRRWAGALLAGEPWRTTARERGLRANAALLRSLRREALRSEATFDRAANTLLFTTSLSSALEARLAGLRAVGYAKEGRSVLLTQSLPPRPLHEHALLKFWRLACTFAGVQAEPPPAIDLQTHPNDQRRADEVLAQQHIAPGYIVVCPMAGGSLDKTHKMWPHFPAFTQRLQALGRHVVACPGPGEERWLAEQHPTATLLSGIDLGVYGALLRRAALVVSNDTGPAHLSAAVGAPVLAVLGPTLPERWAPWGPTVHVERCWPAWPDVDTVLARADAMLRAPQLTRAIVHARPPAPG